MPGAPPLSGGRELMRVAVIGLGGVAERIHLPALAAVPGIEIAGACEPDAARREAMGKTFGITQLHADAETLLAATSPDIVVIGSPPPPPPHPSPLPPRPRAAL